MPWKQRSLRPFLLLLAVVLFFLEIIDRRVGLRPSRSPKATETAAPKKPRKRIKRTPKTPNPVAAEPPPKEPEGESALKAARAKAHRRFKR